MIMKKSTTKRLIIRKEQLRDLDFVRGVALFSTLAPDCDPNLPISNPLVNPGACDPVR